MYSYQDRKPSVDLYRRRAIKTLAAIEARSATLIRCEVKRLVKQGG